MKKNPWFYLSLAGFLAGAVTGLFGAGGGMVLVPLLGSVAGLPEEEVFPTSVAVILPVCAVCLIFVLFRQSLPFLQALPYLAGSAAGGIAAGFLGRKIPTLWLHRILGCFILWGGIRYLW